MVCSGSVLALGDPVPSGYTLVEGHNGAAIFQRGSYYAILVDLDKADIKLDNVESSNMQQNGYEMYKRINLSEHWNKYATSSTVAMVNGQFFDHETNANHAAITYPLYSHGSAINHKIDDNKNTLTLVKNWHGKYKILKGFKPSYINDANLLLVGFDKNKTLGRTDGIIPKDRTYVGGITGDCWIGASTCGFKYLVFIVSNNTRMNSNVAELNKWGVFDEHVMRLDGADSSQLKSRKVSFDASGSARKLPHSIEILNRKDY